MITKLKLPEKMFHKGIMSDKQSGYDKAIDDVQSLNPEMEIDENILTEIICDCHEENQFLGFADRKKPQEMDRIIAKEIIANAPRWLKKKER